jgi:hypothetical protein
LASGCDFPRISFRVTGGDRHSPQHRLSRISYTILTFGSLSKDTSSLWIGKTEKMEKQNSIEHSGEGEASYETGSTTPTKDEIHGMEQEGVAGKDHNVPDISHLEDGSDGSISREHKEYLIRRHGTHELTPLPTMDPADPLNWPSWKVSSLRHQ